MNRVSELEGCVKFIITPTPKQWELKRDEIWRERKVKKTLNSV